MGFGLELEDANLTVEAAGGVDRVGGGNTDRCEGRGSPW